MAQQKQQNQNEKEFFDLVATGRRGVEDMLDKMQDEMVQVAASNVSKDWTAWSQRALVHVSTNDDLRPVLQTKKGIFSIYKELAKAAQMGLQIGGQFPHAYLVPFQGKVGLIITADGYTFSAAHGPGAVLKYPPKVHVVHENDDLRINEAAGEYEFNTEPFGERGKVVGYFTKLEYRDGRIEIPTVTREAVESIAKNYGNTNSPAYKKSPEDMYYKTAAKKLLKKAAAESEGLAMLYDVEMAEPPEDDYAERPVSERVASRTDTIIGQYEEPEEEPEEEIEEQEPKQEAEAEEQGEQPEEGDLF